MALVLIFGAGTAQTTIFSDGFEGSFPGTWYIGNDGGLGGYTWGDNNYWAYAGSWSAFCCDSSNGSLNGANTYKNDRHTYMEKRGVSFSSFTSCSLKFRLKMNTESGYDPFTVNVRDQSGSWHQVYIRSGSNPTWPNWDSVKLNLSSFAGQTGLYIQFRFDSDASVVPSAPAGVWVDEVYCIGRGSTNSADLAMSNLTFLPTPINQGAHPTSVTFRVTNNGPANLASPNTRVLVDYYLSTDQTLNTGTDTWFGSTGMDLTLNSGSYTDISLSSTGLSYITIPASQTPGYYYVFSKIRHDSPSTLTDPTPGNDYTMRSGQIQVVVPSTRVDTLIDDASRITYTTTGNNYYRFNQTSGYWAGIGVRSASGDDWDMALTDNNHSTYYAYSTYGGSTVDYVLGNWNSAATGWYGVVVYPYSVTTSARVEYENGADTWNANSSGSITWPTNDVIEVWDSYMYAGYGYRVSLSSVPSNMDVGVAIHGPGNNFQGRYDALVLSDNAGLGGSESVYLTAATTGWHAIVVWSNNGNSGTISTYTITGVAGEPPSKITPTVFSLDQNRPNPISNKTTVITYALPKETKTELVVYNLSGQLVKTLVKYTQPAGYHNVAWNCRDEQGNKVASGVYLYRLVAGDFVATKKLVVIR
jgi:hypothetical protein